MEGKVAAVPEGSQRTLSRLGSRSRAKTEIGLVLTVAARRVVIKDRPDRSVVLTHGKMLPKAGSNQDFVDSRFRLPSRVKNFFSSNSISFFRINGFNCSCSIRSLCFIASGMALCSINR